MAPRTPHVRRLRARSSNLRADSTESHQGTCAQLSGVLSRLKKDHPNLLGIGVGRRRRKGEIVSEWTLRLIVDRKFRRLPGTLRPLPRRVPVWGNVLGVRVAVMLATDVEQATPFRPATFGVDGGMAASLATWHGPDEERCIGVVTCA